MSEERPEDTEQAEPAGGQVEDAPGLGRYWLRVHGYPIELKEDVVCYDDFYDPTVGALARDPRKHLRPGDIIVYYADGPASVYGVATVTGEVEGPFSDDRHLPRWRVPIKQQAAILAINKAPHAGALAPPSGWHFLRAVRDYTFIRLPDGDGPYLVEQVRARAGRSAE